jgi:ATP synthase protein I
VTDSSGHGGGNDLDRRIAEAQAKHTRGISDAEGRAETRGWAIGIEFVGAVLVSGFIGWGIDNWAGLGTRPWGMIIMLVLGFAAGVRRAMQTSSQFDSDPGNDTANDQGA